MNGGKTEVSVLLGIFLLLIGLAVLVFGAREVRVERWLRLKGVRVQGSVVRHVRGGTSSDRTLDLDGDAHVARRRPRFAMIGYVDADGNPGEIKATSSSTEGWPIGQEVPVVYLPARPSTARVDLGSERRARARACLVVGIGFTVVPIWIIISSAGRG